MCGIFGILFHQSDDPPDEARLRASAQLLFHRGPDFQSTYSQKGVGFAHTRLSMLDLNPRSNQPFWDRKKENCLIYNGEIYNFQALRAELEKLRVEFRTSSDTEVLLESLLHLGFDETLARLEGMYAFAVFNKQADSLLLARDHFGIKPLFVYDGDDRFVFASEIRAMRPWINFEPDVLSISAFLQSGVWPGNYSIPTKNFSFYKDIRIVPPGTKIEVRRGSRATFSRYFSLADFLDADMRKRLARSKPAAVVDELDGRLHDSVRMQLVADAPIGALCGGGVDSSLILALAKKYHSNLAIFHVDVAGCSEYSAALGLAKYLRLDLQRIRATPQMILDNLVTVMEAYGHPFMYHSSSVPFYFVSQLVREKGVKAVLTGEGSDECFIGYPWRVPNPRRMAGQLLRKLFTRSGSTARNRSHVSPMVELHARLEKSLEMEEVQQKFDAIVPGEWSERDLISFELLGYHLRTLLHRNDCLGMAASVESRFPLLDRQIAKLAVNLPYSMKVRFSPALNHPKHPFLIDKWIFRQVAARYIPAELCTRPKMGFHVPAISRLRADPEFFSDSFVENLFELTRREMNHFLSGADREIVQKIIFLELWAQVCLFDVPKDAIRCRVARHLSIASEN